MSDSLVNHMRRRDADARKAARRSYALRMAHITLRHFLRSLANYTALAIICGAVFGLFVWVKP